MFFVAKMLIEFVRQIPELGSSKEIRAHKYYRVLLREMNQKTATAAISAHTNATLFHSEEFVDSVVIDECCCHDRLL